MKLLTLGATGRTGQKLVALAKKQDHYVVAYGRRRAAGADENIIGTFTDAAFNEAVVEADAIVSCLASDNEKPYCADLARTIVMTKPGVRFLTIAGAAVDQPDDNKGIPDKIIGLLMKIMAGRMLADRQAEVDFLYKSNARWTALRPPRLMDERTKGSYSISFDRPHATWIDREDLAKAALDVLNDETMIGKAPFVFAKS